VSSGTPSADIRVVHRAGRTAAIQAAAALALVLLIVGGVGFAVDVRMQNRQIDTQLVTVATTADDVTDPPPGTILAMRGADGGVSASTHADGVTELLSGPAGFTELQIDGRDHRAYVVDTARGRVAAVMDLEPYRTSRKRLLASLGIAELAGILASVAVVAMLTRRSIRPLSQALALQRRFVADASHELRAPLTVLHTRAQLLARRPDVRDTPDLAAQVAALMSDTHALGEVVEDLLASAAMSEGAMPRERIDLAALATRVTTDFAGLADAAGVTLQAEIPSSTWPIEILGSATAVRRAVAALVDNAVSHGHPAGRVTVRAYHHGASARIDVCDDGAGIDPTQIDRLFERFAHGEDTTGRPRYGIGLALVGEIARAHGGDVSVTQTPGGGATFTLTFPGHTTTRVG